MGPEQVSATIRPIAIHIGLDLAAGRSASSDYTAVCVAEVLERVRADAPLPPAPYSVDDLEHETFYRVQFIQRLPHGLSWTEIGGAIVTLLVGLYEEEAARRLRDNRPGIDHAADMLPRTLYADRTGLGDPLVSILQQALHDESRTRTVDVVPLSFVHGEKFDRVRGVVGKLRIVSRLQALLATDPTGVELPKHDPIIPTLRAEIDAYRMTIEASTGIERMGGVGEHDDLVTALALACLDDPRNYRAGEIKFRALGW